MKLLRLAMQLVGEILLLGLAIGLILAVASLVAGYLLLGFVWLTS